MAVAPARPARPQQILVTGATGFIGRSLIAPLRAEGHLVRATTRDLARAAGREEIAWVKANLDVPEEVEAALEGIDAAYYLVHGMGGGRHGFREADRRAAEIFAAAAARAGVRRIIYLGGVAPSGEPSEHLASRLEVGRVLRSGQVPTLELRASLIIGVGSASWQIVRDLALRLPALVLPKWTESRTSPIALEDVLIGLVRALALEPPQSAWFDLPGPEVLNGREMLLKIAELRGRYVPALRVPVLSPSLSSWWLKLVTRADFSLARELVLGFSCDLLPADDRYWGLIGHRPSHTFGAAARRALDSEPPPEGLSGIGGQLVEALIQSFGERLGRRRPPRDR